MPETVVRVFQEAVEQDSSQHLPDVGVRVADSRGQLGIGRQKHEFWYLVLKPVHEVTHSGEPSLHVLQQLLGSCRHSLFAIGQLSYPTIEKSCKPIFSAALVDNNMKNVSCLEP